MLGPWIDHDKAGGLFYNVLFIKALVCGRRMDHELIIVKFGASVEGDDVKLSKRRLK
jgi:hypothetical protein